MVRTYAVIMALIGMNVVLMRALKDGAGMDSTVISAIAWMVMLGLVGAVVGSLAKTTVDESVRTKIEAELTAISDQQATAELKTSTDIV